MTDLASFLLAARAAVDARADTTVDADGNVHGILYGSDDDGRAYATVGFGVSGAYAEIEDGTYGSLQGFRFYLGPDAQFAP